MPHLPGTAGERRDARRELRANRALDDSRFDRWRTRPARLALVGVTGLLCIGILPAFFFLGTLGGIVVTVLAWVSWAVLRVSVRTLADLPERFLDERQRSIRARSYVWAYFAYCWTVCLIATVLLVAFVFRSDDGDSLTLTLIWPQVLSVVLFVTLLPGVLPSMAVALVDRGEPREPATSWAGEEVTA